MATLTFSRFRGITAHSLSAYEILVRRRLCINHCHDDVVVGDQALPVAAAILVVWNKLPGYVTASSSLTAFCRKLKTVLFCTHTK